MTPTPSTRKPLRFLLIVFVLGVMITALQPSSTKGFSVRKIGSNFPYSPEWAIDEPKGVDKEKIKEVLSQDFNYLGSGAECYAFLSSDGKYVLKFFRMKHFTPKRWLKYLPIPGLSAYRFSKVEKRLSHRDALFASYKMAYEELKDETGIVYLHLNRTKRLRVKAHIYDRMRNFYKVNLDDSVFILQKKAQIVSDRLEYLLQKGDREAAVQAIHSLLQQVVYQCKQGYIDRDSGISHNYGFIGNKVIHFDVGRIARDDEAKDPSFYQREVLRVGRKLEKWAETRHPDLLPDLEDEINRWIDLEVSDSPSL